MSQPTEFIVMIDGKPHPHAFTVRFMARLFRNAQRAAGHRAYIISKGVQAMSEREISVLKRKAAKHLKEYHDACDHLDCGGAMAQLVSIDARERAIAFDAAMDELATLDPLCPTFRITTS